MNGPILAAVLLGIHPFARAFRDEVKPPELIWITNVYHMERVVACWTNVPEVRVAYGSIQHFTDAQWQVITNEFFDLLTNTTVTVYGKEKR